MAVLAAEQRARTAQDHASMAMLTVEVKRYVNIAKSYVDEGQRGGRFFDQ